MNILEEQEEVVTEPYKLRGCIYSTVERMDDEFTKMLQACDAHSPEYIERWDAAEWGLLICYFCKYDVTINCSGSYIFTFFQVSWTI